jgi:membrane protein implicated in regulation of membrane protease activity
MLVFASLAIAALVLARPLLRRLPGLSDRSTLNRRGDQYIGRLVVLESPIINGRGRAFVGDTLWSVEGGDQPAGATVRVTGANGATLLVEKS